NYELGKTLHIGQTSHICDGKNLTNYSKDVAIKIIYDFPSPDKLTDADFIKFNLRRKPNDCRIYHPEVFFLNMLTTVDQVVTILDSFTDEINLLYIIYRPIDNPINLYDFMIKKQDGGSSLTDRLARKVFANVVVGLKACWTDHGVIHRNVNPTSIVLDEKS